MKQLSASTTLVAAWAGASTILLLIGIASGAPLIGLTATLILFSSIAVTWWAPTVASVVFAAAFMFQASVPGLFSFLDALLAIFFCGLIAYRYRLAHVGVMVVVLGAAGLYDPTAGRFTTDPLPVVIWLFQLLMAAVIGWSIQRWERSRREMAEELRQRRREIARALHDSVAASLTSVVIKAEVLGLAQEGKDEEIARQLRGIAEDSRRSMQQVRQLITVLDSAERDELAASIESLSTVLHDGRARFIDFGFDVIPADFGAAELPVVLEPARVDLVDKFLAEVATNALKYAPPGSTIVMDTVLADGHFELSVANDTKAIGDVRGRLSSGLGLRNLREDAQRLGGNLAAQRVDDRWHTALRLPA